MTELLKLTGVAKSFTLHLQGGVRLPVISGVDFTVNAGECVVLGGASGAGKSSILKMVYGNYGAGTGRIEILHGDARVDIATADPRTMLAIRRQTLGYVSQFLRAIPRVSALDVAAEPLLRAGVAADEARVRAADLFRRLNLPERLWTLPPSTFSGGEQQRVNIARGFLPDQKVLLLDEPTASLDRRNRDVVVQMIAEKKASGVGLLGIFHDEDVREAVADRVIDVTRFAPEATAA
ncbi:phosphonate C-P lyase system protein PhnL [Minwuia sp.]|uniref:phosphonate C-P lyase system protein PhnL n=1 Tax=Minwuia sp. TaxID=2493630 RepID=UPI003A95A2A4